MSVKQNKNAPKWRKQPHKQAALGAGYRKADIQPAKRYTARSAHMPYRARRGA